MTLIHGLHDNTKQSNEITYCISPKCAFNQSYFYLNPKNPNPLHFYKIYWLILHLTPTTQKWTTLLTNSSNLPSNSISTITFPPKPNHNFSWSFQHFLHRNHVHTLNRLRKIGDQT